MAPKNDPKKNPLKGILKLRAPSKTAGPNDSSSRILPPSASMTISKLPDTRTKFFLQAEEDDQKLRRERLAEQERQLKQEEWKAPSNALTSISQLPNTPSKHRLQADSDANAKKKEKVAVQKQELMQEEFKARKQDYLNKESQRLTAEENSLKERKAEAQRQKEASQKESAQIQAQRRAAALALSLSSTLSSSAAVASHMQVTAPARTQLRPAAVYPKPQEEWMYNEIVQAEKNMPTSAIPPVSNFAITWRLLLSSNDPNKPIHSSPHLASTYPANLNTRMAWFAFSNALLGGFKSQINPWTTGRERAAADEVIRLWEAGKCQYSIDAPRYRRRPLGSAASTYSGLLVSQECDKTRREQKDVTIQNLESALQVLSRERSNATITVTANVQLDAPRGPKFPNPNGYR